MSVMRRSGSAVAALVLAVAGTAGLGLATGSADAVRPGVHARSVLPAIGHYSGRDGHNRVVTFSYNGHSIHSVKVNGHLIVSSAPVQGAQVHHTCDHHLHKCVRGHWFNDHTFQGVWNDPNQGHESSFQAHFVS